MSFHLVVRRTHLYLAMFLLSWFLMYAVSSVPFSHAERFNRGPAPRTVRLDRPYELAVPESGDLRAVGAQLLREAGLQGAYGVYRPNPKQLNVYRFDFWASSEINYFQDQKRLRVLDYQRPWHQFLTGMHARGGFQQETFLNDAWAVLVDLVQMGILFWIASGIYMWWKIPQVRGWGWLALGGGAASAVVFLVGL